MGNSYKMPGNGYFCCIVTESFLYKDEDGVIESVVVGDADMSFKDRWS